MRRTTAALTAIILAASLLQGCWNYREIDNLLIVAGFAVDRGYEGHRYHVTTDLADTSKAGKDKPVVSTLVESEGDTIESAVRNLVERVGMQLYWQNCQIVIVGQDVAEESILPVLDWLHREVEPRITMELFISQEMTARELLKNQSATMSITSFEIDKMYELNEKAQPVAQYLELYDIYNQLADKGRALALPALRLVDNLGDKTCALNGMALFSQDKLTGYLTPTDSMYAMFVMNHVKGGAFDVKAPTGNTIAALNIFSSSTKVTPRVENGKLQFIVETKTEAAIDENDTIEDITQDAQARGKFEFMAESQLAAEIGKTVQIVQSQYGLDIFGFGDDLHNSDPAAWRKVSENWNEAFKTAQVQISCKIHIRNSNQSRGPVQKGG